MLGIVGGHGARKRVVVTVAFGSVAVATFAAAPTCGGCNSLVVEPPKPPTPPTATVDASPPPPPAEAGADAPAAPCVEGVHYRTPVARSMRRESEGRIVGGKPTDWGDFPFVVALTTPSGFQYCAATMHSGVWARTAAHCKVEIGDRVRVWPGFDPVRLSDSRVRSIRVVAVRTAIAYDESQLPRYDWDAAAIRLEESAGVASAPMARGFTGITSSPVGWGRLCSGCQSSDWLLKVDVPTWNGLDPSFPQRSHSGCRAHYPTLTERMLCAGAKGTDSCQGDSGGGLFESQEGVWTQLGIVSHGRGCADRDPGVYTNLMDRGIADFFQRCARDLE